MDRREEIAQKYGKYFWAIDTLRPLPAIDCDKLTKLVVYSLVEEAERLTHKEEAK